MSFSPIPQTHHPLVSIPANCPRSSIPPVPAHIRALHWMEWIVSSGVDPDIVSLNVESLRDTALDPTEDSTFPIAERLNWKVTRFGLYTRHTVSGWWVSGLDPLDGFKRMLWGRFKPDPDTPVIDREKGEPAKYLSPSLGKNSSRLVLLDVPFHVWERVSDRYRIPISAAAHVLGFWHWVWANNIPIILTEGEKKAGCLLTQGYAAIALPGIFNGYRKDPHRLIPELEYFAKSGRVVYICFDYEVKPKTLKNIQVAISRLGKLLIKASCQVFVIDLPGPEKGVDDFILAQGSAAFDGAYQAAVAWEYWTGQKLWALTYPISLELNQRYLGKLPLPNSGLAGVQSAKNSGKTSSLEDLIKKATDEGRRVLVLTHRIQLGKAICDKIGVDWIEEMRKSDTQGLLGYGLCVDSLHPLSQARFNPQAWKGAIVILDECEQVIWHLLNSSTCANHRVKICENLKALVQVVLDSGGLIIAQDADLSDLTLDYLKAIAEREIDPFLVVNRWKPQAENWKTTFYDTKNPTPLVDRLLQVAASGKVYVALDAQKVKSKWSSINLETYLEGRLPGKRILRIDSESVADPEHPAYGVVSHLDAAIASYDIIIATPTLGTGVSIDVRGHFAAVFGIFQGATPDAESRQALARVRDPVPRFIWAARFGPGKVGNGSCSYQDLSSATELKLKHSLNILKDIDFDIDSQTDPIHLRTWAKMAARTNVSLWQFRQALCNALVREGHQVTVLTDDAKKLQADGTTPIPFIGVEAIANVKDYHAVADLADIYTGIKDTQEVNHGMEAVGTSGEEKITPAEYDKLKDQRAKTKSDRRKQRKYELEKRYQTDLTPELVLKDDDGWYPQIRLHYYLMFNAEFVQMRDVKEFQGHLERGSGKVALQDIKLLSDQVQSLKKLGIPALLDPNREVRPIDPDVEQLYGWVTGHHYDFKSIFNITFSERMTPIEVIQALLSKMGLRLTYQYRDQLPDGRRAGPRVYRYEPTEDGRSDIFALWEARDQAALEQHQANLQKPEGAIADPQKDPPPDNNDLNVSRGGSEMENTPSEKREKEPPPIKLARGSIVRWVSQACEMVVDWVDGVRVGLRRLHGASEEVATLQDLEVVTGGSGRSAGSLPVTGIVPGNWVRYTGEDAATRQVSGNRLLEVLGIRQSDRGEPEAEVKADGWFCSRWVAIADLRLVK